MGVCEEIRKELERRGYNITYDREDTHRCVLNFVDKILYEKAKEKFGEDEAKWISTSSVVYDKEKESVEANLVAPLEKFCELYLDECCSDETNLCRVHVDPEYPRVGLEIKAADLKKLREALDDFFNCTR